MPNLTLRLSKQTSVWNNIHKEQAEILPASLISSHQRDEWFRLKNYWYAQTHKPKSLLFKGGRKSIKNKAAGTGQVLKKSFIKNQIGIETVF